MLLSPSKRAALIRAARKHGIAQRALRRRQEIQLAGRGGAVWDETHDDMLRAAFGRALRAARVARGLTQEHVARALGSHRPIIARTERGVHVLELRTAVRHAHVVGLTLDDVCALIDAAGR